MRPWLLLVISSRVSLAIIIPTMFSLDVALTELLLFLIRFKFSFKYFDFLSILFHNAFVVLYELHIFLAILL